MSCGTEYTSFSRVVQFCSMNSADSAWFAKLMSMTLEGCPSADARLMSLPSPRTLIFLPFGKREFLDELADLPLLLLHLIQRLKVDLDVEVARVAHDGAVLH